MREQLDAVPHEVSHGGVHDKAQLQVKTTSGLKGLQLLMVYKSTLKKSVVFFNKVLQFFCKMVSKKMVL